MKKIATFINDITDVINQISKIVILEASDGRIFRTNEELVLYEEELHYKNKLRCVDDKWFYCHDLKDFQTLQKIYICKICRLYDTEPFTNLKFRSVTEFMDKMVDEYNLELFSWVYDNPFKGPDYYCLEVTPDGEAFTMISVSDIKNAYNRWKSKFEFGITLK